MPGPLQLSHDKGAYKGKADRWFDHGQDSKGSSGTGTLKEGELVELEVRKAKKSWFGTMPGIGSMTREDELDVHG